jgi:hypothetical protein
MPIPGHNSTVPVHYDLHVWSNEDNPSGTFAQFQPGSQQRPQVRGKSRTQSQRHRASRAVARRLPPAVHHDQRRDPSLPR